MSLPKEPRQLMINLMYLVLTALLAMNVSKEVINAFTIVDKSIGRSNDNIDSKNKATMENFDLAQNDEELEAKKREKVAKAMKIAEEARAETKQMVDQLDVYRQAIIVSAGDIVPETGKIKREADLEAATAYMITGKKGADMKSQLEKHKASMAAFIDELPPDMKMSRNDKTFAEKLPINFDIDNPDKTWSENMFEMVPAVAAVTIIDKYKNDVKNAESAVLDELWASAMGEKRQQKIVPDRVFNKYGIIASLDNSYALPGQTINLTSMLGAFNADSKGLRIWINGRQVPAKQGIAETKIKASSKPGKHSVKIRAQYLDKGQNDDDVDTWKNVEEYTLNYFVGQPQASISLDKMKIFYKGLDNPMTVAASGVQLRDITVKAGPNLKITEQGKGSGKYKVYPSKNNGKSWVQIFGKKSDGTIQNFGKIEYRLGRVPNPEAEIAGKKTGSMPANTFEAQQAVFAKLRGFPYDLKFTVISFTYVYWSKKDGLQRPINVKSQFLNHPNGNSEVRGYMKKLRPGDRVFIEEIKAVGPDKTDIRKLGGLSFTFPN